MFRDYLRRAGERIWNALALNLGGDSSFSVTFRTKHSFEIRCAAASFHISSKIRLRYCCLLSTRSIFVGRGKGCATGQKRSSTGEVNGYDRSTHDDYLHIA